MVAAGCVAAILVMVVCMRSRRKMPPLGHDDLVRLSLYSERIRREELHPFL